MASDLGQYSLERLVSITARLPVRQPWTVHKIVHNWVKPKHKAQSHSAKGTIGTSQENRLKNDALHGKLPLLRSRTET